MLNKLKLGELLLLALAGAAGNSKDVEANGLGKRTALTNGNNITLSDTESRRNVGSKVLMSLLVTVVLGDVVKVLTSENDGTVHLGGNNGTGENLTTDGDKTNEGALLVNVRTLDSLLGSLETKTDLLIPSLGLLVDLGLGVLEDVRLLKKNVSILIFKIIKKIMRPKPSHEKRVSSVEKASSAQAESQTESIKDYLVPGIVYLFEKFSSCLDHLVVAVVVLFSSPIMHFS